MASRLEKSLRKVSARRASDKQRMQQTASVLDAMHPARIGSHLPSNEEEYKTAEHHDSIADSAKRRGAGQVMSSGVALRPSGDKAYREFHDLYTREEEKKPLQYSSNLTQFKGQAPEFQNHKTIAFPENFCILCMKKDVAPSKGCDDRAARKCHCCSMLDITTFDIALPELDIKPLDQIRSVICAECKLEIFQESYQSKMSGIKVVHEGQIVPLHVVKAIHRYKLLKSNWEYVLSAARIVQIQGGQLQGGLKVEGVASA